MEKTPEEINVFLVEDNSDDEELAKWALKKVGITKVTVARDGGEAISMLLGPDRLTALPDLILLDLRLPKVDGLAVLQKLRADTRTCHLKVIALSSSEDPHDKKTCRDLGVIEFFSKPLSVKMLQDYLASHAEHADRQTLADGDSSDDSGIVP